MFELFKLRNWGRTAGADPGIFNWGVQTLVQKGPLNFFVANYFSPAPPHLLPPVAVAS